MREHDMEYYIKNGTEYSSIINRLVIRQTSTNKFDLTLKPKIIIADLFPSFYNLEVEVKENNKILITSHKHLILYSISAFMLVMLFLMGLSFDASFSLEVVIFTILFVLVKVYGYYQLNSIKQRIISGDGI